MPRRAVSSSNPRRRRQRIVAAGSLALAGIVGAGVLLWPSPASPELPIPVLTRPSPASVERPELPRPVRKIAEAEPARPASGKSGKSWEHGEYIQAFLRRARERFPTKDYSRIKQVWSGSKNRPYQSFFVGGNIIEMEFIFMKDGSSSGKTQFLCLDAKRAAGDRGEFNWEKYCEMNYLAGYRVYVTKIWAPTSQ